MKKGLCALLGAAFLFSIAGPVLAADEMKIGLGYFRANAPVGIRAWVNEQVAIDVGLGFALREVPDIESTTAGETTNKLAFDFDAGAPIVLAGNEDTKFFVRPGFAYSAEPNPVSYPSGAKFETATRIHISGTLGVEHFFSDRFSLGAGHGAAIRISDSGVEGSDSVMDIVSEAFGITSVGFHYYIKGVE